MRRRSIGMGKEERQGEAGRGREAGRQGGRERQGEAGRGRERQGKGNGERGTKMDAPRLGGDGDRQAAEDALHHGEMLEVVMCLS